MHPFRYTHATDDTAAIATLAADPAAAFIAGGTSLIDLMKDGVEAPSHLVDITALSLADVTVTEAGLRLGALSLMSDVAANDAVRREYPAITEALLASASPQLRNMATIGGNVLQRTRCPYFRDPAFPCNKRDPGTGCAALMGEHRMHAILGTSAQCIATHPSDLAVALVALDAVVEVIGSAGERSIPLTDFYLLPGETPERENVLAHGELIVAVSVPAGAYAARSHYLKVRDRASYEFALTSAAVALTLDGDTIREARVALGGVGTVPWRSHAAEDRLRGAALNEATLAAAAEAAVRDARPRRDNAFKVELVQHTLVRALQTVGGMA